MNLKIKSLFVLLIISSFGFGQRDLSALEAVSISLEHNFQIQIAEKQHAINERNNSWSEAGAFPTVDLTVMNNNTIQDNTNNPFTFTPGIILSQGINPSLSANWNIFSGFSVRISKQRLEQLEAQSANNAMAIIETTVQDVLKAYYTAQLQKDRLELFQNVMGLSRDQFNYYAVKEKYSTSNSLELLQFRNQYLTDSTNMLMQEISYDNAIRNLKVLMNDSTLNSVELNLTDELQVDVFDLNFDAAEEEMLESNANLRNQYISLELQKSNTSLRRSFLYPTLSFQAGVNPSWSKLRNLQNDTLEFTTNNLSYYGNLTLRYTLFNNWKNKRAVEVSKIQEEIASLNIQSMQQTLRSTLQNLIDLYKVRAKLVEISTENMMYAEKALNLAKKRFELGSLNSVEFASFQNTYQNTMIQHYENLFNKMDTFWEIQKMTGKLGLDYLK